MALRISFSIATNQYVVGKVSVEVHFWRHSTTRGCASLVRASIVLWYRSPDVEISSRASYKSPNDRWKAARKAGWRCVARGNSRAVRSVDGDGSVSASRRTDLYEGILTNDAAAF